MKSIMSLVGKMTKVSEKTLSKTGTKVEQFKLKSGNLLFPLSATEDTKYIIGDKAKLITLGQKNTARISENNFFTRPDQYLLVEDSFFGGKTIYTFKDGKLIQYPYQRECGFDIVDFCGNQTESFERLKQHMRDAQLTDNQLWR